MKRGNDTLPVVIAVSVLIGVTFTTLLNMAPSPLGGRERGFVAIVKNLHDGKSVSADDFRSFQDAVMAFRVEYVAKESGISKEEILAMMRRENQRVIYAPAELTPVETVTNPKIPTAPATKP